MNKAITIVLYDEIEVIRSVMEEYGLLSIYDAYKLDGWWYSGFREEIEAILATGNQVQAVNRAHKAIRGYLQVSD